MMTPETHSLACVAVNPSIVAVSGSAPVAPVGKAAAPVAILLEVSRRTRVVFCSCDGGRMAAFRCRAKEGRFLGTLPGSEEIKEAAAYGR